VVAAETEDDDLCPATATMVLEARLVKEGKKGG
jgi:hypothetical protein